MNHVITIGSVLLTLGAGGGILAAAVGGLMAYAADQSDAGDAGPANIGCAVFIAGAVVAALCIVGLVL